MRIKVIHTRLDVTLKTKYNDNIKEKENNDQYLVCITRLTLPKDFLNDNNDSKLTMLGGRLFQTLIIRSLKMFSHINTTMADAVMKSTIVDGYVDCVEEDRSV